MPYDPDGSGYHAVPPPPLPGFQSQPLGKATPGYGNRELFSGGTAVHSLGPIQPPLPAVPPPPQPPVSPSDPPEGSRGFSVIPPPPEEPNPDEALKMRIMDAISRAPWVLDPPVYKSEKEKDPEVKKTAGSQEPQRKKKRKSRWGDEKDKIKVPTALPANVENMEFYIIRSRLDEVTRKLTNPSAAFAAESPSDSPSPEPIYDSNGKRLNTREQRFRDKLVNERESLVQRALKLNPSYRPPSDYRPAPKTAKLYIPLKEYPDYNFIGLIIGPRGNTQKKMEKETNCHISIRGKGSVKEGKGRREQKREPGDDDELHVLVSADSEADLRKGVERVRKLLIPVEDGKNDTKRQQLRELAAINGTLRDDDYCRTCGELGHRSFNCPNKKQTWTPADVCCALCGERSHPTADCPFRDKINDPANRAKIDREYEDFMSEISGGGGPIAPPLPQQPPPPTGPRVTCFNCGKPGHMSNECQEPRRPAGAERLCFHCQRPGHISAECPERKTGANRTCFNCGKHGHVNSECPEPRGVGRSCFNCGQSGHLSSECPTRSFQSMPPPPPPGYPPQGYSSAYGGFRGY